MPIAVIDWLVVTGKVGGLRIGMPQSAGGTPADDEWFCCQRVTDILMYEFQLAIAESALCHHVPGSPEWLGRAMLPAQIPADICWFAYLLADYQTAQKSTLLLRKQLPIVHNCYIKTHGKAE
jgi:hypothetical protein